MNYIDRIKTIEDSVAPEEWVKVDFDEIFERCDGAFWPFGIKDYRWKRSVRRLRAAPQRYRRWLGSLSNVIRNLFFRYRRIVVFSSVLVFVLSVEVASRGSNEAASTMVEALWLAVSFLNLAIMMEFIYGSVVLVDYFRYFHLMDLRFRYPGAESSGHPNLRTFDGIWRIVELLGLVALSGISFIFFACLSGPDFNIGQGSGGTWVSDPASTAKLLVECAYFVVTTMSTTGYGDIHPIGTWGYILCTCLEIEVFTLIVLAAATFWSARQAPGGKRGVPGSDG